MTREKKTGTLKRHTTIAGFSKSSSYLVDVFLVLLPNIVSCPVVGVVEVAIVVTASVNKVGVAVIEPVPVTTGMTMERAMSVSVSVIDVTACDLI